MGSYIISITSIMNINQDEVDSLIIGIEQC